MTPEKVIIGNAELWHGDCKDVLPLLPVHDLLLTDPPYGIGFASQPTNCRRNNGAVKEYWDEYAVADALIQKMLDLTGCAIVWGGNYYSLRPSRGWLVWQKPDAMPSFASLELAWTSMDMNSRIISHSNSATNPERVGHPTQKPIRVMAWCLSFAPQAVSVLDPFMGSGTTGVACMQHKRKFTGIERERKYFDIACRRIEDAQRQTTLEFEE